MLMREGMNMTRKITGIFSIVKSIKKGNISSPEGIESSLDLNFINLDDLVFAFESRTVWTPECDIKANAILDGIHNTIEQYDKLAKYYKKQGMLDKFKEIKSKIRELRILGNKIINTTELWDAAGLTEHKLKFKQDLHNAYMLTDDKNKKEFVEKKKEDFKNKLHDDAGWRDTNEVVIESKVLIGFIADKDPLLLDELNNEAFDTFKKYFHEYAEAKQSWTRKANGKRKTVAGVVLSLIHI